MRRPAAMGKASRGTSGTNRQSAPNAITEARGDAQEGRLHSLPRNHLRRCFAHLRRRVSDPPGFHDTPAWRKNLSCSSAANVVQPAEYRFRDDLSACLPREGLCLAAWNYLAQRAVRAPAIVIGDRPAAQIKRRDCVRVAGENHPVLRASIADKREGYIASSIGIFLSMLHRGIGAARQAR
jgi:hypothetical protein